MERKRFQTRTTRRALTGASVAAATLAAALPAAATSPGRNGALAFIAAPTVGAPVLEVLPPGAAKPHAILRAVPYAGDAAVSPDGRRVAFAAGFGYADHPEPPADLWTMGIGGAGRSLVAASAGSPAWSPDGRTLAYVKDGAIWLRAAAGGRPRRVALRGCPCLSPSWSPDSGRIVYTSHPSSSVYRMLVATRTGRFVRRLGGGRDPAWSPDGASIAFTVGRVEADLVVMRADGSFRHRLGPHTTVEERWPSWSPDGRSVLVRLGTNTPTGRIEVVDVGSGSTRALPSHAGRARFTPDGGVVYDENGRLHLADAQGANDRVISSPIALVPFDRQLFAPPSFTADGRTLAVGPYRLNRATGVTTRAGVPEYTVPSPDGTRIAWSINGPLTVADASGANAIVVAHGNDTLANTLGVAWSPDGTRIAFTRQLFDERSEPAHAARIEVVDLGTHAVTIVGPTWLNAGAICWSPDGTRLVFDAYRRFHRGPHRPGIWTVSASGGPATQIAGNGVGPVWSPDGTRIAYVPTPDARVAGTTIRTITPAGTDPRVVVRARSGLVGLAWQPLVP